MAVSFVAAAVGSANPTTSFTVVVPTCIAGDWLILAFTSRGHTNVTAHPTVVDNDTGGNTWTRINSSTSRQAQMWAKYATSATSAKTITVTGCVDSSAAVLKVFRGVSQTASVGLSGQGQSLASGSETAIGFIPHQIRSITCAIIFNLAAANAVTTLAFATDGALTATEALSTGGNDCAVAFGHRATPQTRVNDTGNLTWAQTDGATYSFVFCVQPPLPTDTAWETEVNVDGPGAWWQLKDTTGTICADSSGNGRHMTYRNTPLLNQAALIAGETGAVDFNGTNHYADLPGGLVQGGSAITVEAVVNNNSVGNRCIAALFGSETDQGYWLTYSNLGSGWIQFLVSIDGTVEHNAGIANGAPMGTTKHIVGTYDGTTIRLYINGVLVATNGGFGGGAIHVVGTGNAQAIGRIGAVNFDYIDGVIDDVVIYQSVLSPARIASHAITAGLSDIDIVVERGGSQPAPSGKLTSNKVTAFGLSGQSGTGDRTFGISLTGLTNQLYDNCLVVTVQTRGGPVNGITFNGVALTPAQEVYNIPMYTGIWYLLAPPEVAANVVVDIADAGAGCHIGVAILSGVDQTDPVRAINGTPFGVRTSVSTNVTSSKNDVVVDSLAGPDNNTGTDPTIGAGQNVIYAPDSTPGDCRGVSSREYGAASVNMAWTTLRSENWGHAVVSFQPAFRQAVLGGSQPAPAGVLARRQTLLRTANGSQPAPTGVLAVAQVSRPVGSTAGNWTNEGGAASLHAALADDTNATYAQLLDGNDPSTMVISMATVDVPALAGGGKIRMRTRRV